MTHETYDIWNSMKGVKYRNTVDAAVKVIEEAGGNIGACLKGILDSVCRDIHAEAGVLWIYNKEGDGLIYPRAVFGTGTLNRDPLVYGHDIPGEVIEKGAPKIIADCQADPRWEGKIDPKTGFIVRSIMCAPLTVGDFTFGCVQIINRDDAELFDERDLEFMSGVCRSIAEALSGELLFTEFLSPAAINPDNIPMAIFGGKARDVAVLYVHIYNYDEVCVKLSPEDASVISTEFLRLTTNVVTENGGRIYKFEGDSITAVWGLSGASDNPAGRAAKTAVLMLKSTADFSADMRARFGIRPGLAAGIDFGKAFVGNSGNRFRLDTMILGSTVAMAKLLGRNAESDSALITADVRSSLEAGMKARPLVRKIRIQGVKQALQVFELKRF